jgi:HAD superfamily hydrolase (TIGR01549 family)
MDEFLPAYFRALTQKVAHLVAPDEFLNLIVQSTQRAIANTEPTRTNQDVFMDNFVPAVGQDLAEQLMPMFDDFYANDFPALEKFTERRPEAREVVQQAFDQGFDVAIATNPLFPRQAILHRLAWAGVADFPYTLITSYENMHFTKPHPEYYHEIAERIDHDSTTCLMAGDDIENDILPAAQAGMRTFWLTDTPHDHHPADWAGHLIDIKDIINA